VFQTANTKVIDHAYGMIKPTQERVVSLVEREEAELSSGVLPRRS